MNHLVGHGKDGKPFYAIVLEPGNLERLRKGDPILLHLEDMFEKGVPRRLDLLISYSETPVADAREFAAGVKIALDERTPATQATRPHCPECKNLIEQMGVWRNEIVSLPFCPNCGCVFGALAGKIEVPTTKAATR